MENGTVTMSKVHGEERNLLPSAEEKQRDRI